MTHSWSVRDASFRYLERNTLDWSYLQHTSLSNMGLTSTLSTKVLLHLDLFGVGKRGLSLFRWRYGSRTAAWSGNVQRGLVIFPETDRTNHSNRTLQHTQSNLIIRPTPWLLQVAPTRRKSTVGMICSHQRRIRWNIHLSPSFRRNVGMSLYYKGVYISRVYSNW